MLTNFQSFAFGRKRSIGPMMPKVRDKNQTAPLANLKGEINRGESANQYTNQQRSIDFAKENTTPKADENGGVETMVTPKEDTERERRKSIRGDQSYRLRAQERVVATIAYDEDELGSGELHEDDAENKKQPRTPYESARLIYPE